VPAQAGADGEQHIALRVELRNRGVESEVANAPWVVLRDGPATGRAGEDARADPLREPAKRIPRAGGDRAAARPDQGPLGPRQQPDGLLDRRAVWLSRRGPLDRRHLGVHRAVLLIDGYLH